MRMRWGLDGGFAVEGGVNFGFGVVVSSMDGDMLGCAWRGLSRFLV